MKKPSRGKVLKKFEWKLDPEVIPFLNNYYLNEFKNMRVFPRILWLILIPITLYFINRNDPNAFQFTLYRTLINFSIFAVLIWLSVKTKLGMPKKMTLRIFENGEQEIKRNGDIFSKLNVSEILFQTETTLVILNDASGVKNIFTIPKNVFGEVSSGNNNI